MQHAVVENNKIPKIIVGFKIVIFSPIEVDILVAKFGSLPKAVTNLFNVSKAVELPPINFHRCNS